MSPAFATSTSKLVFLARNRSWYLASCKEQISDILYTKAMVYDSGGFLQSDQHIKLLFIEGFPYPWAILPCRLDGSCGYHSCIRHFYPAWGCEISEYTEKVLNLRNAVRQFHLEHWSNDLETQLLTDYPFLKGAPGSSVKANFKEMFYKLEVSYPDMVSLSLIEEAWFVLLVIPIQGKISVHEIFHVRLDPSSLHTIFLLQTGADPKAEEYRSHYDVMFSMSSIDGKEVEKMGAEEMKAACRKCCVLANTFTRFRCYSNVEVLQCGRIFNQQETKCLLQIVLLPFS